MDTRLSNALAARGYIERLKCLAAWPDDPARANAELRAKLGPHSSFLEAVTKADVAIATGLTHPALANAALAAPVMEIISRRTILGRLDGTLPMPPRARVAIVTHPAIGAWTLPVPATLINVDSVTSEPTALSGIVGTSRELARMTDDRATRLFERHIVRGVRDIEDTSLLDAEAAVSLVRPAGLLAGLTASGAGSPAMISDDIQALWDDVRSGDPERPYFVMSSRGAMYLAAQRDGGARLYPNIDVVSGGNIHGVPVIIAKAATNRLILIDAAALAVADDGLNIDVSHEAALQLTDVPSAGATTSVSAFQTNTSFLKIERLIFWALGHADGVGYIDLPIVGSPA